MKKIIIFMSVWAVIVGVVIALDEKGKLKELINQFFSDSNSQNLSQKESSTQKNLEETARKHQVASTPKNKTNTKTSLREDSQKITNKKPIRMDKSKEKRIFKNLVSDFKKGKFEECWRDCNAIDRGALSSKMRDSIDKLSYQSKAGILLTQGIARKPKVKNSIDRIVMDNGKEYLGEILSKTSFSVEIRVELDSKSNMTLPLPRQKIAKMEQLSAKQYQKKIYLSLNKRIKKLHPKNKKEILNLVTDCYKNNKSSLVAKVLYQVDKTSSLKDLLEYKARHLYQCYLWHSTVGEEQTGKKYLAQIINDYSNTNIAREAQQEINRPKQKTPEQIQEEQQILQEIVSSQKNLPSKANQGASEILTKANRYYDSGYAHLKKSFPGEPNADKELELAKQDLKKACQLYQQSLNNSPDKNVEKKLQQAMEYYHHCIKQTRISR